MVIKMRIMVASVGKGNRLEKGMRKLFRNDRIILQIEVEMIWAYKIIKMY